MFIFKNEKEQIQNEIKILKAQIKDLDKGILSVRESIASHRNVISTLLTQVEILKNPPSVEKKPRKKHTMSAEGRAKMSQIMKDRHAKAKLEKQNANSINTTSI